MRYLFIVTTIIVLSGCRGEISKPDKNKITIDHRYISFPRGERDSKLNLNFQCFYSSRNLFSDSISIHYFYDLRKILLLNLDSKRKRFIEVGKPVAERLGFSSTNVYQVNGTIYLANDNGKIYQLNDSVPVLKCDINANPQMKQRMLVMSPKCGFYREFTFLNPNELIFQCVLNQEGWKKNIQHYPILAKLNLKTKKIQFYNYRLREELKRINRPMLTDIYQTVAGDKLLVSYMFSPSVDVISLKTKKQTGTIELKSTYQTGEIPSLKAGASGFEEERFAIETPYYGPIIYNPYKQCSYHIYYHQLPERTRNGDFTIQQDKRVSVAIFDKTNRWVGEIKLKNAYAGPITPTPRGFLLNLNDLKITNDEIQFKEYLHE